MSATTSQILALLVTAGATLVPIAATANVPLTGNLLVNPGAEDGVVLPWTAGGSASPFAASMTTIPPFADLGFHPRSGTFYFVGGRSGSGYLSQVLSLQSILQVTSALIDSGQALANVSTWHMNFDQRGGPVDVGTLSLNFLSATGSSLGSFSSGELINSVSNGATASSYKQFAATVSLPAGTRSIEYRLDFILNSGPNSDTDVYFDDSNLSIAVIPEPSSTLLLLAGLAALRTLAAARARSRTEA